MTTVFCFAGSWGTSAELPADTPTFGDHFARHFNLPFKNCAKQQHGTGLVLHTLTTKLNEMSSDDIVLVLCPPDIRWYDQTSSGEFVPLTVDDRNYRYFLGNKQISWFHYHHALFIYSIQKILNDVGCRYLMALDYGNIDPIKSYPFKIDYNKFVSDQDLTSILVGIAPGHGSSWLNTLSEESPSEHIFKGEYFEGCRWHPNAKGHKKIADLFIDKYKDLYIR